MPAGINKIPKKIRQNQELLEAMEAEVQYQRLEEEERDREYIKDMDKKITHNLYALIYPHWFSHIL